jgi:phosphatidylserine/phosphatidylglycerophosphate/cardiolipin synthase-like enzyme
MEMLNPSDNIDRLVSLINQAEKFVVMVSPFTNLQGWDHLREAIVKAVERGVDLSYYVRGGEGRKGLEGLNIRVFEVCSLHAKLFFSEKEAMITSFHLLYNEDINWACIPAFPEEYRELVRFFEDHLKPVAVEV